MQKSIKKKIAATVLATCLVANVATPSFAAERPEGVTFENGLEYTTELDCAIYEPTGTEPRGILDPYEVKSGKSIVRDQENFKQWGKGWVNVLDKENGKGYWHYTNTQLKDSNKNVVAESGRVYDYGYVETETDKVSNGYSYTCYVYYGDIGSIDPS